MSIAIVILAAGESSRLGEPKQHIITGEQLLLQERCETACLLTQRAALEFNPLVVCGKWFAKDAMLLREQNVECIANSAWEKGQHSSLRFGFDHRENADAILVMLVDQYRVSVSDFASLIDAWRANETEPVAAAYADTIGAPAIWPNSQLRTMLATGNSPKKQLERIPHSTVPLPSAAWDLDTQKDKQLMKSWFTKRASNA